MAPSSAFSDDKSNNLLFSESLVALRKKRAQHTFHKAPYLALDIERFLQERLLKLEKTKSILILGCPGNSLDSFLKSQEFLGHIDHFNPLITPLTNLSEQKSYDIIVDGFNFHWINDPLTYLRHIYLLLKPGGVYHCGFLGGTTLTELRKTFLQTDSDLFQGAFARISPMIKAEAATRLIQSAGFHNSVVEHDEVAVNYNSLKDLVQDLRSMGENNALSSLAKTTPKASKTYLSHAEKTYKKLFSWDQFQMTYDFIFMSGWRK